MRVIAKAGAYTPPDGGESSRWIEHLARDDLSLGTYRIPAGGPGDQTPHAEDEIYVVREGRATLVTPSGTAAVGPGSVVFVPAGTAWICPPGLGLHHPLDTQLYFQAANKLACDEDWCRILSQSLVLLLWAGHSGSGSSCHPWLVSQARSAVGWFGSGLRS